MSREVHQLEAARTEAGRNFFERADWHGETQQPAYLDLVLKASERLARLLRLNDPASYASAMASEQRAKVIEVTVRTREQVDLISTQSIDFKDPAVLDGPIS